MKIKKKAAITVGATVRYTDLALTKAFRRESSNLALYRGVVRSIYKAADNQCATVLWTVPGQKKRPLSHNIPLKALILAES